MEGSPTEQGYNTNFRPLQFDEKADATFTRSLMLVNVPIVTNVPGAPSSSTQYYEFLLDLNQSGGGAISIDQVQIFLGSAGNLTNYPTGLGTKVYDTAGDPNYGWVALNDFAAGGGKPEMFLDVPVSDFTGPNPFVYLYSHFGGQGGIYAATNGFEEWGVQGLKGIVGISTLVDGTGVTSLPVGSTVFDTTTLTVTTPPFDTKSGKAPPAPTGTITYAFFANGNGFGTPPATYTVTVSGTGTVPDSPSTAALSAGTYSYVAVYSGDNNYFPATGNPEPFTITPLSPTIATTPTPASVALGIAPPTLKDSAVLSGGYAETGTITYTLSLNNTIV